MDRHLWLVGMMGSGKTATAAILGERWGVRVIDTDAEIVVAAGETIAQMWHAEGEAPFRAREAEAVRRVASGAPAVVATGGGVVLDGANVAAMRRSGRVVWLQAAPELLAARVGGGAGRPLLDNDASPQRLGEILASRRAAYAAAAHLSVDTSELTVAQVADRIEEWWSGF